MNLRHIEIFHAVYVNGSVSAAARALHISQPSVSKTLRHAESLLGFPLFERGKGRLVPTQDAHALFEEVREIQDRVLALREAGRNLKRGTGGTLRISALPSIALSALPAAVARFLRSHPGTTFELQTIHHDDLLRKLYERETDLALAYAVPDAAPVGHRWLGESELMVLHRSQDLPDAPARVPLEMLQGRPFISLTQSGPTGALFAREVQRLGLELDEVVQARTFYIASALVRAGVGVSVVDSFTAEAALFPGVVARPLSPPIVFDVKAIFLESRPPGTLETDFLKTFAQVIASS